MYNDLTDEEETCYARKITIEKCLKLLKYHRYLIKHGEKT